MKKIGHMVIGALIGTALTLTASVAAQEIKSLIGKRIDGEFTVILDGQELSVKAGTIEGTSYLPVRAISEALNLKVDFDAQTGIHLEKKEVAEEPVETSQYQQTEYKGVKALKINGEVYFEIHDYQLKNPSAQDIFRTSLDGEKTYITKTDGSTIEFDTNDPAIMKVVNGEPYINVQYFPDE